MRLSSYLAAVIPLLFGGGLDAIGLLGLAASCCRGNEELAEVCALITATEAAWAELADLGREERQLFTRKLVRVIALAQSLTVYG